MRKAIIFMSNVGYKLIAIYCLIITRKWLIVVDKELLAIHCGITIDDAKYISEYLVNKAEKRKGELQQESALIEAKQILNGRK